MRKRFLAIAALAIALTAGLWYVTIGSPARSSSGTETGITIGKAAPEFTLKSLDGKPVTVAKSGKITVLNFWATWCPPCRQEMPELDVFAKKHTGKILFGAVNLQEPADKVKAYMEQNSYSMPILLDEDGTVSAAFAIRAIPTTIILDKNGVIQYRKPGPVTAAELEGVLQELQVK